MRTSVLSLIMASLILSFSLTGMAASQDESLVLHLTFDEGEGNTVVDDSMYQNNGTLIKGPKWVAGKFGSAVKFDDPGDTVEIKHDDSLNMTDAITMEMWVKASGGVEVKQSGIEKGIWGDGDTVSIQYMKAAQ